MFGTNPLRKQDLSGLIQVKSIFPTIQGEGPFAGESCIFVRLAGCNLRCFFCDTDFEGDTKVYVTVGGLVDAIMNVKPSSRTRLVVFTGGEPFRQNFIPAAQRLIDMYQMVVQVETAGTLWIPEALDLARREFINPPYAPFHIVCSPKTGKVVYEIAHFCTNWKYIIRVGGIDEKDGLPNLSTQVPGKEQKLFRPPREGDTVWLQPCEEYDVSSETCVQGVAHSPEDIGPMSDQKVTGSVRDAARSEANIQLCGQLAMKHGYKVSLQLHKYLHLP
jgi:organic radical activating enzyme